MKKILLTLSTLFFLSFSLFATDGYEIKVKIDGFKEKQLSLGYHYGDKQYIKDTIDIDANGYFVFKGDEALDAGVYLVIMPPDNQFFQILVDENEQHFTVETKQDDLVKNMKFKGAPDNEIFYKYLNYLSGMIPIQKGISEKLKAATTQEKKDKLKDRLQDLDKEVKKYHTDLIKKYPKSMSALMIKPRLEIEMPEFEGDKKTVSINRYRFYKKHYFDNLDLGDVRLLRTPFLYERVIYYTEKLTPQHPDSISQSIDYLLKKMKPSEDTYKYYLVHFLNKYASSKVVGMDAVYVHLADNYYCKGLAPWTDEEQIEKICDNARRLKPVLIGKKARNLTTIDRDGKKHQLHDFKTEYTILYFWASDCGHCKKMTPFLIDFNEQYKSKGVSIMTICKPKSGEYKECWDYIDEKDKMDNMLNTYDPSNRAQIYYNVRSTPNMFILNKNKEIIMKGIGADQLKEVMDEIILRDQKKENK